MHRRSILVNYHLRNLNLFHIARIWCILYRGYTLSRYEFSCEDPIFCRDIDNLDCIGTSKYKRKRIKVYKDSILCDCSGQYCLNFN